MAATTLDQARTLAARWQASRPSRALQLYYEARGSVLAAGIAYFAVFSIFPALAVGFTVFALFLGSREQLQADLVEYINTTFGFALIALEPQDEGLVTVDQLVQTSTVGITGLVGVVVLLWTGLGWLSATRQGIRAVFGQPPNTSFVVGKLRDLLVLVTLGALVLFSVAASVLVSAATGNLADWLGMGQGAWASLAVRLISVGILLVVDMLIFLLFFRLLAGVSVPVRDLVPGAMAGAVGLAALTFFGELLLGMASGNQFLATFSVIVGLLLWTNFAAQATLLAASWSAATAIEHGHLPVPAGSGLVAPPPRLGPARVSGAGRPRTASAGVPTYGQRSADRVTLAAGAVLGAGAVLAGRVVSGAARALRDALR